METSCCCCCLLQVHQQSSCSKHILGCRITSLMNFFWALKQAFKDKISEEAGVYSAKDFPLIFCSTDHGIQRRVSIQNLTLTSSKLEYLHTTIDLYIVLLRYLPPYSCDTYTSKGLKTKDDKAGYWDVCHSTWGVCTCADHSCESILCRVDNVTLFNTRILKMPTDLLYVGCECFITNMGWQCWIWGRRSKSRKQDGYWLS